MIKSKLMMTESVVQMRAWKSDFSSALKLYIKFSLHLCSLTVIIV